MKQTTAYKTDPRAVAPTRGQALANSLTHGIGALLSVIGTVALIAGASQSGDAWKIVSFSIFGASLILLYLASALYHGARRPELKRAFKTLDHCAIFLLIAGTYTPFTLVNLRGPWGWSLFGVVWGLALLGILLQTGKRRHPVLAVVLYVVMGWTVVVAIRPLLHAIPPGGLALLVTGGLAYTAGIAFYAWKRLPYAHSVWHGFVLLGSALHFFAILLFVVP